MDFRTLGSDERFERLCKLLLLREFPSLQTVDGRAGDEGKDCFIGTFENARHVFQIKYFDRIGPNQRKQIEKSLEAASRQKPDKWTLLVSTEFSKYDWKWFDQLRKKYHSIELNVWQSTKIEELTLDPKNDGLKDVFPQLFPVPTIIDRAVKRTLEQSRSAAQQTAVSLVSRLANDATSKDQLLRLLKESRFMQYSAEIFAANKMVEQLNDEEAATRTFGEVYAKATSEGDERNELSAIYGLLTTLGKVPDPDPKLLRLADRGIELAKKIGAIDALALIESQKALMLQSLLLSRERRLTVTATVLKTTGTLDEVLPFLKTEGEILQELRKQAMDASKDAGTHAFESRNMRVIGTVIMNIGFSTGVTAFNYKILKQDSQPFEDSAASLLEQSRSIFAEINDDELLSYAENSLALFWWMMGQGERAEEHAKKAVALAKKVGNRFVEVRASDTLEELKRGHIPTSEPQKIDYTPESQEEVIRFAIKQMGFNIDNPTNPTEKAIAMGIKDLNPERVLRYCEHMNVDQISTSHLGQVVGIPTIGLKRVTCMKFGHSVEGIDLDLTSDAFKKIRCESCNERKPRDPSWKWSFE